MRRATAGAFAALLTIGLGVTASRAGDDAPPPTPCCRNAEMFGECPRETHRYDTRIDWHDDLELAKRRAAEKKRLLLVLHISGDFHDPGRT